MGKAANKLITEMLRNVPHERLIAAMGLVLQIRHERAGFGEVYRLQDDPGNQLHDFLPTNSIRQLKLLRKIAEGLIVEKISKEQYEREKSLKRH